MRFVQSRDMFLNLSPGDHKTNGLQCNLLAQLATRVGNMAHVFISYSHKDSDFVFGALKPRLEEHAFEVWVDTERLKAGDDWREEIDHAIRSAFAMV
ncbi:toll/interleukin-1 receptor domain-containing protein, partial [Chloroflexota bacterium]